VTDPGRPLRRLGTVGHGRLVTMDTLDTDIGHDGHPGARVSIDAGLAVDEAAAHAGVSDRTIRRALKASAGDVGYLPSWRVKGPRGAEYRIALLALDEWMGRREALDGEAGQIGQAGKTSTRDSQASQASQADTVVHPVHSAAVQVIVAQLVAPLVESLERTQQEIGAVREALGLERALREQAERDLLELRRAQRARPWWLRMLLNRM